MTSAAVMMVRVFIKAMVTGAVLVVRVATSVKRHNIVPVRGLARRRFPAEGRRQHRHEQDGN